jgi:transcriptional regulator with XRE-family HTH domain
MSQHDTPWASTIGQHLTRERERMGLTAADLASVDGLTAADVARLEASDRDVPLRVAERYAGAIGLRLVAQPAWVSYWCTADREATV